MYILQKINLHIGLSAKYNITLSYYSKIKLYFQNSIKMGLFLQIFQLTEMLNKN